MLSSHTSSAISTSVSGTPVSTFKLNQAMLLLETLKTENTTLRKPCSICGTLVKPKLMKQHNTAYHTKKT